VRSTSGIGRRGVTPDTTIAVVVRVKMRGGRRGGGDVELMLKRRAGGDEPPYQRLLGDAMRGVGELFARQDLVEAQWRAVQPILSNVAPLYTYEPDTWGPKEAHQLIGDYGPWIDPQTPAEK